MSIQESAIFSCTICLSASSEPWVVRESARSHIWSNDLRTCPMVRIAWWIRPPPRRVCATTKPPPRSSQQMVLRHLHVLVADVGVVAPLASWPTPTLRTMFMPGASVGTMKVESRL